MASGKVHALDCVIVGVGMGATGFLVTRDPTSAACLVGGGFLGIIITPDLDVDAGCISYRVVDWFIGVPAGLVWRLIWLPYAKRLGHRSFWSHFPIVSTLIRLVYLGLIGWALGLERILDIDLFSFLYYLALATIALMTSDLLHYLRDRRPSDAQ